MKIERRAMARLIHRGAARAWRSWLELLADRARMRRALAGFANAAILKAMNSWLAWSEAHAEQMRKALFGASAFLNIAVRRAWNAWRSALASVGPLRRAMSHLLSRKLSKGLNKLVAMAQKRRELRAKLYRLAHIKAGRAVNSWKANAASRRRVGRVGAGWLHRAERKALNSWFFYVAGKLRLAALVHSWRGGVQRGFNQWVEATRRQNDVPLGSPINLRSIRVMTWREVCVWLHRINIPVSRSPPTLLRTLRAGAPYAEIVRRIMPTFWVRHKLGKISNPVTLFTTLQQFFETDMVTRIVGFQRLDVRALDEGKAIEHLELLASMREILDATIEHEVARHGVVYAPD